MKNTIHLWDCLEIMKSIPDGSIDAIITDPPYGTTACKWDSVIPFEPMWKELKRIIKPNGAIVLFWSEPFSSLLRTSNLKMYKYDWIWIRNNATKYLSKKFNPLSIYENISVFLKEDMQDLAIYLKLKRTKLAISKKEMDNLLWTNTLYSFYEGRNVNGDFTYSKPNIEHYEKLKKILQLDNRFDSYIKNWHTLNHQWIKKLNSPKIQSQRKKHRKDSFYSYEAKEYTQEYTNYPKDVLYFDKDKIRLHPTQKPVALLEYLIKTYTNEWETVLDFTAWSGTTWVACQNTNRNYILIEKDEWYFEIIKKRLWDQ